MKRFVFFAAAQMVMGSLWAQQQLVNTRIMAEPCGQFFVDGAPFTVEAAFEWPEGSVHTLSLGQSYVVSEGIMCQSVATPLDGSSSCEVAWQNACSPNPPPCSKAPTAPCATAGSWVDSNGNVVPGGGTVTIVASSTVSYYRSDTTLVYLVQIVFTAPISELSCDLANNPGAGYLLLDGVCYAQNTQIWLPEYSVITLQAIAPQGWVFSGWLQGTWSGIVANAGSFVLVRPVTIGPLFAPGIPVTMLTSPPQMKLVADSVLLISPAYLTWALNSSHSLTSSEPQLDMFGRPWVWLSWSQGGPESQIYTTGGTLSPITLTANYALGGRVTFGTNPPGLLLVIDGRSNWPSYGFLWAVGSTHTMSAPLQQSFQGRVYTFNSWSTPGGADQQYTVTSTDQVGVVATYDELGQLRILSTPGNINILVDGTACQTPCEVDRKPGTQVTLSAPASVSLSDSMRLDFTSWSDGAARQRTWTAGTDVTVLMVNYQSSDRVQAVSDPAGGATFQFNPTSPDGFYPVNTNVTVTVVPAPGYKFKMWAGDASGTSTSVQVNTSLPVFLRAEMVPVPYVMPAGVDNAAGDGPAPQAVAPGSLIAIFGGALAPDSVTGPSSPLAQTLAGVTVQVGDQLLPLMFVSPAQINAQLPSSVAAGQYTLLVRGETQPDATMTFAVRRNAPGVFTNPVGTKQYALAMHADGSVVTPASPAAHGETVTVLSTGLGPYAGFALDGFAIPAGTVLPLADTATIQAGGQAITPVDVLAAVGYVGITAIRWKIGDDLPSATDVAFTVVVNNFQSNQVLLPIQ